ncbi:tyrosine-protein phosphatase [Terripilifer ovatus]|uniref:phosphatase domain-containing protein n=1 Tax=Terripilifer ovatus TaxID=3032367 RepID=UPI003AB9206A
MRRTRSRPRGCSRKAQRCGCRSGFQKKIKTVLNLRGPAPGKEWFDRELDVVRTAGAEHISIRMSANREPDERTISNLVSTLTNVKTPLLIHCEGGADRSGLAAALYERAVKHRSTTDATAQLSFRYGHFPWLTSRTGAMDRAFAHFIQAH